MLRVEYNRYGGPEELRLVDSALGQPQKDQLRVRVKAASINPVDCKIRAGVLKMMTGKQFPRGMGQDFAGVVEAVGPEVKRFRVGDEVFGVMEMKEAAAFAEEILTPEHTATSKPTALSFEQAATLATVGQTAWATLIDAGHLQAGQSVFVNGCMGSVGRCAIQVAHLVGAEVSGTCSPQDLAEARTLGVKQAIDYHRFDAAQFRGQFDVVLDASGNLTVGQCSKLLRGKGVALHINATFGKMFRVMLAARNKLVFLGRNPELLAKVRDAAVQGKLALPIRKTVPLRDVILATVELEEKGTPKGKVVVVPA